MHHVSVCAHNYLKTRESVCLLLCLCICLSKEGARISMLKNPDIDPNVTSSSSSSPDSSRYRYPRTTSLCYSLFPHVFYSSVQVNRPHATFKRITLGSYTVLKTLSIPAISIQTQNYFLIFSIFPFPQLRGWLILQQEVAC